MYDGESLRKGTNKSGVPRNRESQAGRFATDTGLDKRLNRPHSCHQST
jgi:hypothetical protein